MPPIHPELGPDAKEELASIRQMFAELRALPPEYDFQLPVMISHAGQHAAEGEARLRRYAGQVVGARIVQFGFLNIYKAVYLTESFLTGRKERNPYQVAYAARSLMEIAAVVTNVWDVINSNRGDHADRLAERVTLIDEILIQATYGHRSEKLAVFFQNFPLSKLRAVEKSDERSFVARNVLTRLSKWQGSGSYPQCQTDYSILSEILHPNAWQNTILMGISPYGDKFARISRRSDDPTTWVLGCSCRPAERSLKVIHSSLHESPPFKEEISPPLPGMAQSPTPLN